MSQIGRNIKKIRGIKSLSQNAFAEIFAIKRANVGAYEEGRAEPKVALIIKIAEHFGISVDDFLRKDITVNDLFQFDRRTGYLPAKGMLAANTSSAALQAVPLVLRPKDSAYAGLQLLEAEVPVLHLPLPEGRYRAFELSADEDETRGDIAVGQWLGNDVSACIPGHDYLVETNEQKVWWRRFQRVAEDSSYWQQRTGGPYTQELPLEKISAIYQVCMRLTKRISQTDFLVDRVAHLEKNFLALYERLKDA